MFRTLFSRMLATYLGIAFLLMVLLGVTVSGMFKNQYVSEKESELRREAEEINSIVTTKYIDADKRSVARDELNTIVRKHDALLQLRFDDEVLGKLVFMDGESVEKWEPLSDLDITEIYSQKTSAGTVDIRNDVFSSAASFPVLSLSCPIRDAEGNTIGTMYLHEDMSRTRDSIEKVYLDVLLSALIAVVLAFFAVSYITSKMTKPITDMNRTVMRFSKGDFDARVDVSSRDEVGQLAASFNVMADELDALEESRRTFVANVSHELRSPLTSMRGFLEAMQDGTIPPEEHEKYLGIVVGECKRMTGMVNDLLDLARIESGTYELKSESFDINELMIRTLLTFEARANAKHIEVETDFEKEHVMVEADPAQIAQVVRNLIDNAIKFSPDGGRLMLTVKIAKDKAVATVRDTGEGISAEDLPHVFDRFYKGEKAHTPSGSSSGLGLSIVKRIIEQHGETITAQSPEGGGASFTFTLKLAQQQQRSRTYHQSRK